MIFLKENAREALALYPDMLNETLPHRLVANRAITGDGSTTAVADKLDLSVLLQ